MNVKAKNVKLGLPPNSYRGKILFDFATNKQHLEKIKNKWIGKAKKCGRSDIIFIIVKPKATKYYGIYRTNFKSKGLKRGRKPKDYIGSIQFAQQKFFIEVEKEQSLVKQRIDLMNDFQKVFTTIKRNFSQLQVLYDDFLEQLEYAIMLYNQNDKLKEAQTQMKIVNFWFLGAKDYRNVINYRNFMRELSIEEKDRMPKLLNYTEKGFSQKKVLGFQDAFDNYIKDMRKNSENVFGLILELPKTKIIQNGKETLVIPEYIKQPLQINERKFRNMKNEQKDYWEREFRKLLTRIYSSNIPNKDKSYFLTKFRSLASQLSVAY